MQPHFIFLSCFVPTPSQLPVLPNKPAQLAPALNTGRGFELLCSYFTSNSLEQYKEYTSNESEERTDNPNHKFKKISWYPIRVNIYF